MYVSTQEDLLTFVEQVRTAPLLAIDTEFHREKTYHARLCLLQFATEELSAIVDPLTVGDLSALAPLMTDPAIVKVFHAASQDIEILIAACGAAPSPIFDTQVAAGLLGYPQQMGYGALVKAMCDVALPKADSYTDWMRRPLSQTQLEYAIDDVLYLPEIYRKMVDGLEKNGRLSWLENDFHHLCDPATYEAVPEEAWRRVKRISSLSRRQLAVVQAVAAWRERTAEKRDVPRKWVLTDEVIVEIARRVPETSYELFEVRGLRERLTERSVKEILDVIAEQLATDPTTWPKMKRKTGSSHEVESAVDLLSALLHFRARQRGVATQFLASHDDLVKLAKGEGDDLPLMQGWRYDMIGHELSELLEGKMLIGLDAGELSVRSVEVPSADAVPVSSGNDK